jgi:cytochrome c oxidase cbb3-type subunit III
MRTRNTRSQKPGAKSQRIRAFYWLLASGSWLLLPALLPSCKREKREFQVPPPDADVIYKLSTTDFQAGGSTTQPAGYQGFVHNNYDENAYALTQGQQLFHQFNCSGCHANGGGGMGPPLMDDKWIYGDRPEQIFATIVEGRPNGMPSWRNRIPDYEVWQITAYVRSLSGLTNPNASGNRDDHMKAQTPPASMDPQHPRQSFMPPGSESTP